MRRRVVGGGVTGVHACGVRGEERGGGGGEREYKGSK